MKRWTKFSNAKTSAITGIAITAKKIVTVNTITAITAIAATIDDNTFNIVAKTNEITAITTISADTIPGFFSNAEKNCDVVGHRTNGLTPTSGVGNEY